MKKIKLLMTSICFMAPFMVGVNANAETVNNINSDTPSLEMSTVQNADKIRLELLLGDTTPYANICVATADNYVNIRSKADNESEILGKLYTGSAAVIEDLQGEWVKVSSGSVEGYIAAEYVAVGHEIEDYLDEYVLKYATINTVTLRVREKANDEAATIALVAQGSSYQVVREKDGWVKIEVDGKYGYVSKEYVDFTYEFDNAVSIEEEQANIAAEEAARAAEEAAARAAAEAQAAANAAAQATQSTTSNKTSSSSSSSSSNSSSSSSNNSTSSNSSSNSTSSNSSSTSNSGTGSSLASYAQQFVGNPYVWGGTSLTNGTDCSGFTQSVFKHFGYSIPRTSRQQAKYGTSVSASNLQKGDLICYASGGTVNHVAIYIGNGKVVHASNAKDGIKISNYNYRTPYTIRRVIK